MTDRVTVHQETAVAERPADLMTIIQRVVEGPLNLEKVEVLERLLAMQERVTAQQREAAFADALTQAQSEVPPMRKDGSIVVKGVLRSKYVTIDTLDDVLRPIMEKYGFSFTLSEVGIKEGMREFAGTLMHRSGYTKTLSVHLPLDKSDFRSAVQSEGSTISYARRQLYKAHFNIVERGLDDDGSGQSLEEITADEAADLHTRLVDTKSNVPAFLNYFGIADLKTMRKADLSRAYEMIDRKSRGGK